MLADRIKVTLVLLPIGLVLFYLGGVLYTIAIAFILALAAREYAQLFRLASLQPNSALIIMGVTILTGARAVDGFESTPWIMVALILATMTVHLVAYERGRNEAGTDFGITLSAIVYFGWLGSYLISLRQLPGGFWWLLITLGVVWIADSGAYVVGRNFGRHALAPRLSPKKTWEGYWGAVVAGPLGGLLLIWLFNALPLEGPQMSYWHGAVLGLVLAVVTPLGDLGKSMVKRQMGVKDSGKLLPGHGGAWDRMDTWLWAAAIGYYLITWFMIG